VPDAPELVTQVIDVRNLARWLVEAGGRDVCGIFNATGDTVLLTQHLQVARTLAGTLSWEMTRDPARPRGTGLSDDIERSLLQTLAGS
jgi:hypothetical protein